MPLFYAQRGFTLIQLLISLVLVGILASLAFPAYRQHIQNSRLTEAQAALLTNARFMEQFYSEHKSFKATSTSWPTLPLTQTDHFCIRLQGNARGANSEKFTIKAVAFDKTQESRTIKINDDLSTQLCASTLSSCSDGNTFFSGANGTDQNCTVYR